MKPEIVIRPLPDRAAELGVTTETLGAVTRIATSGDVENSLAKLNLANRQIPIRVQLRDEARTDLERIRMLSVPGRHGPVPLISVAEVSLGAGPAQITRYDRSRNVTIQADPDQLEQLLINLVRNAADATLEMGGGAVTVGWRRFKDTVEIWVDDEGAGLSNTANLFVPFFTTKPGGSGIGLVLCRQIAEAHEGSLRLENRSDRRGARALLALPA